MQFYRFDEAQALPVDGSENASYYPIHVNDRTAAMILVFDRKGASGRRVVEVPILMTVISGDGRVRSGLTVADVFAGDVLLIPAHEEHEIWTTNNPMTVILQRLMNS